MSWYLVFDMGVARGLPHPIGSPGRLKTPKLLIDATYCQVPPERIPLQFRSPEHQRTKAHMRHPSEFLWYMNLTKELA